MGHASPFYTSKFKELFNDKKKILNPIAITL
jgi:hypothetical protein